MRKPFTIELIAVTLLIVALPMVSMCAEAQGYGRPGNYTVMPPVYGGNGFAHQTIYGPDGSYNITHFPSTHGYGYQPNYGYNRPFAEGYQMGRDLGTIINMFKGQQ